MELSHVAQISVAMPQDSYTMELGGRGSPNATLSQPECDAFVPRRELVHLICAMPPSHAFRALSRCPRSHASLQLQQPLHRPKMSMHSWISVSFHGGGSACVPPVCTQAQPNMSTSPGEVLRPVRSGMGIEEVRDSAAVFWLFFSPVVHNARGIRSQQAYAALVEVVPAHHA
jgi:hypothetical protein